MKFHILLLLFIVFELSAQGGKRIILDADTGNEVDDLFAVTRALLEPGWNIIALNAAQWQASQWAIEETMENSHRLNQVLVGEIGSKTLTLRGGVGRMYDWGDMAQHSAAAYQIIEEAEKTIGKEQLTIVVLGALTNIGSAIYIEPSIADKLKIYWLGTTYDFEGDIMKKLDFNCLMDPQALDVVLESEAELHIIPVNVASQMKFSREEVLEKLDGQGALGTFLSDRWTDHLDGSRKDRVIWDLAIVQAAIDPSMVTEVDITSSKENGNRSIHYIRDIDVERMKADFYKVFEAFIKNSK
ncbi:nucleoside hydrolase [Portibacter marinus]|uniref:nucleoside hydrolase n=1 Tax=Portibacter marinus TaxID=2898660 RepID=UPI001F32036C|nr:nucleoside hydrolase [Portibacter marinus]